MGTCKERVGDVWNRALCGKEAVEVLGNEPLCKRHAKAYRVRHKMDTGEKLEIRYYLVDHAIEKVEGVITKKYFIIRKNSTAFGRNDYFYKTNIDIDSKNLFERFSSAKLELCRKLRDHIIDLRADIAQAEDLLKKADA